LSPLDGIPRLKLGVYPTPIEEMPRLRAVLNKELGGACPRLFIKRDDYTGPGFGGNKVRKLEYVFAEAMRRRADAVLTIGGIRSNHARVTAALAARLGFQCHLILNGAAEDPPASLYLDELYGAHIHRVGQPQERTPEMQRIAKELRVRGSNPMEIPLGASDALGALGYVQAAEELAGQASEPFAAIFVCSSSGGTQAGLDAGLQLFGMGGTRLIGVSPDGAAESILPVVSAIRDELAARLKRDFTRLLSIEDRFTGAGYGIPSREGQQATRLLAQTEGIVLDPVYTAKTMAAMLAHVRAREFGPDQAVLFIHTGGQLALFAARRDLRPA
jgi:L-cysteate sulfo-lyase